MTDYVYLYDQLLINFCMHSTAPGFSPSVFSPFYFIRSYLRDSIAKKAPELTGRLLDFGCGSKPYRSFFVVDEYIGIDYENEGHPHDNEQIDVFYDGKSIPFHDEYFDSVLCSEVFEHVFNLDEIVLELNRVMKKGGKILITCPFVWNEHEVPHDYARYTQFALRSILQKGGFEIIDYSKSGNFITSIFQLWVLYCHTVIYPRANRFFLLRWVYKFTFVLVPNLTGKLMNVIFPENKSFYLNNIILAKKIN